MNDDCSAGHVFTGTVPVLALFPSQEFVAHSCQMHVVERPVPREECGTVRVQFDARVDEENRQSGRGKVTFFS